MNIQLTNGNRLSETVQVVRRLFYAGTHAIFYHGQTFDPAEKICIGVAMERRSFR